LLAVIVTINCPPAGTVAAPKDRVALASKANRYPGSPADQVHPSIKVL
jgi:hypothetical protein